MHNNTYMILDDNGVVIAQYMSLDIALILLRALCETYYADPTGWTIIADNIEIDALEDDNHDTPSKVAWDEEQKTWKQPPAMLLKKQVADIKEGIAESFLGSCPYPRYVGPAPNKSKVVDEKEVIAGKQ